MSAQKRSETLFFRELVIDSDPGQIHLVESFIEEIRENLRFKDDVFGNVMIATTEAVNNGIMHGNKEDERKKVSIRITQLSTYRLKVEVHDEGDGFDPASLPDPTAPENLENIGGRGVFIMSHLSDSLTFHDEGRLAEMIFNI